MSTGYQGWFASGTVPIQNVNLSIFCGLPLLMTCLTYFGIEKDSAVEHHLCMFVTHGIPMFLVHASRLFGCIDHKTELKMIAHVGSICHIVSSICVYTSSKMLESDLIIYSMVLPLILTWSFLIRGFGEMQGILAPAPLWQKLVVTWISFVLGFQGCLNTVAIQYLSTVIFFSWISTSTLCVLHHYITTAMVHLQSSLESWVKKHNELLGSVFDATFTLTKQGTELRICKSSEVADLLFGQSMTGHALESFVEDRDALLNFVQSAIACHTGGVRRLLVTCRSNTSSFDCELHIVSGTDELLVGLTIVGEKRQRPMVDMMEMRQMLRARSSSSGRGTSPPRSPPHQDTWSGMAAKARHVISRLIAGCPSVVSPKKTSDTGSETSFEGMYQFVTDVITMIMGNPELSTMLTCEIEEGDRPFLRIEDCDARASSLFGSDLQGKPLDVFLHASSYLLYQTAVNALMVSAVSHQPYPLGYAVSSFGKLCFMTTWTNEGIGAKVHAVQLPGNKRRHSSDCRRTKLVLLMVEFFSSPLENLNACDLQERSTEVTNPGDSVSQIGQIESIDPEDSGASPSIRGDSSQLGRRTKMAFSTAGQHGPSSEDWSSHLRPALQRSTSPSLQDRKPPRRIATPAPSTFAEDND
eukprot:gnl/MRDRNA2_/MRDRNA2_86581_c0_seq2.p1 gnl/MRDRNA2_/MRDRNA2_86581_c0~~gnl/MRDRNA2_/MRDRNA2_86581_c0_seq2.p1  ORF type:complete len:639 (+),score=71.43 gnl/MRDRNA2_/MRDRNA2_86581_c0_seq2:71-1987(+)